MKKSVVLLVSLLAVALFAGKSFTDETGTAGTTFTAKQLIGLEVDNQEGEHIGKIRDINLDTDTGEINYVILGKSLLGIGEDTTVAVPLEVLEIKSVEGGLTATLTVPEIKLLGAPRIAPGESTGDFKDRLLRYYR